MNVSDDQVTSEQTQVSKLSEFRDLGQTCMRILAGIDRLGG